MNHMKNRVLLLLCMLMSITSSTILAQSERIIMKDGTIYNGFISHQRFGENAGVEITYSDFTRQFRVEDVESEEQYRKKDAELSSEWQAWANENNKYMNVGGEKFLSLSRLKLPEIGAVECCVIERGTKFVKVFAIHNGVAQTTSSNIRCIIKEKRDPLLLTDMNDVVKTEMDSYEGILLEQYPGAQLKIWNSYNNSIIVINNNEVKAKGRGKFNPDYSIWEQTKFLEQLELSSNVTTEKGVLIESGTDNVNIIFMTQKDGRDITRQYSYKDVKGIKKTVNPKYNPIYDVILEKGESRINRDSVIRYANIKEYQYTGPFKLYYLDPVLDSTIVKVNTPDIAIETNMGPISDVYVFKATPRNAQAGKETIELLTYTYEDLFNSKINVKHSVSINGTQKLLFTVPEPGVYFVYLRNLNKCWVFETDFVAKK